MRHSASSTAHSKTELARLTRELNEAREQQTATSEVFAVINRSAFDLTAVLETVAESSVRLCGADRAFIFRFDGELLRMVVGYNSSPEFKEWVAQHPIRPGRHSGSARAALERRTIHIPDVQTDPEYTYGAKYAEAIRTVLGVPILKDDDLLGVMMIYHLEGVRPFTDRQIALVETFANQAAIAIENVRLFEQVQAKTRDLTRALAYQTGSSNILKVIASSPTDVAPVLQAIVENACTLCNAYDAIVALKDGDDLQFSAHHGPIPIRLGEKWPINRKWTAGRALLDQKPVQVRDSVAEGHDFSQGRELSRRMGGLRTVLSAPLLRENESIGVITLRRTEVSPFSEDQIALLQTFADQAVIAMENVRLFDEVQARTRELTEALEIQTASANILRAIASSPTDVAPVLKVIVESACELCKAYDAVALLKEGEYLLFGAHHGSIPIELGSIRISRSWTPGLAVIEQRPVHIHDLLSSEGDQVPEAQRRAKEFGYRTILSVPMLREKESVGVLALRRAEAHPFDNKQIALLQSFADQAVIAIENARLFEQLQARTSELSQSLDELRTAQDRLVHTEKLASLGQLTAGIAHEIKNPLNFVNNFASLSRELIEELKQAIQGTQLDVGRRSDVDEIITTLSGNLEKVSQHGKRADSIVKNMLLHSREGTGEHRLVAVNALVEESLNLAYHAARAESPDFNVKLEKNLDPNAREADIYPQEITRVLLNLISNGFYAASKRKSAIGDPDFIPILSMSTMDLGPAVQILIRDNGVGIPEEVRDKIFTPFFTTKPAGEGTGLGLSISHDIIVKQHGGQLDVSSKPGEYTEFVIKLPRSRPDLALKAAR